MRLTVPMADWLVDRFASRLNAGTLSIYSGTMPLADLQFQSPAFLAAVDTVAEANPMPPAVVQATGDADRAELITSSGEVLADVRVRPADAEDVEIGDVVVTRTDFHRGGLCEVGRITLTVPLRSCLRP